MFFAKPDLTGVIMFYSVILLIMIFLLLYFVLKY